MTLSSTYHTDKYYFYDAAYTHSCGFMAPFHNVRYWLADSQIGACLRIKEDLRNNAHARLKNLIERAYGVLKARFPILKRIDAIPFLTSEILSLDL